MSVFHFPVISLKFNLCDKFNYDLLESVFPTCLAICEQEWVGLKFLISSLVYMDSPRQFTDSKSY